jgi:WD40 repeat protein/tRNA A-37 threonylcarbamoyl transferase component Bud32
MPPAACPNQDQLVAFHGGDLPEDALAAVEAHLEACPRCEAVLTELECAEHPVFDLLRRHPPAFLHGGAKPDVPPAAAAEAEGQPGWLPADKYELLGEVGHGGMGVVFKARQVKANRVVALKVIRPGRHATLEEKVRFRLEAEAVARLQHPNIVQLYEVDEHGGTPFLLLEYVEGGSLAERLKGGAVPARQAAVLVEKLARAMHYAHSRGVLHRDLKPANVLLTSGGEPKVTDFGLAKRLDEDAGRTATGAVMGTPSYMAPEQAAGRTREVGPLTDVYALGVVLYECLTGRPPFQGESALDTLAKVTSEEPPPPSRLARKVPRDLETICLKCLRKDPGRRYAGAESLADDLRRFLEDRPIHARRVGVCGRAVRFARRRPAVAFLLLVIVLLLVGGAGAVLWQWRQTEGALAEAEVNLYFNNILLADGEWTALRAGRADALLDACRPEQRGFEWYMLKRRCHGELLLLEAGPAAHAAIAWTPDGTRIMTGANAGKARLWDATTGQLLFNLSGHTGRVEQVAVSLDGKLVASASNDHTARVWDATTGRAVVTFSGHSGPVLGIALHPGGRLAASVSQDRTVKLWDARTGEVVRTLSGHTQAVFCVAFSPDGRRVVSGGGDAEAGEVKVWDTDSGREVTPAGLKGYRHRVLCAAFRPGGVLVATAGDVPDNRMPERSDIRVWDSLTGTEKFCFRGHALRVRGLAFSPDGELLASASQDGSARLWDLKEGDEVRAYRLPTAAVQVAFNHDGSRLAVAAADGMVRLFDATTEQGTATYAPGTRLQHVAFSPDGRLIATAGGDGRVMVRERDAGRLLMTVRHAGKWAGTLSVAFSPDGTRLASASREDAVKVWDMASGKELLSLTHANVRAAVFSPDGTHLASAGDDGIVRLWDAHGIKIWAWEAHAKEIRTLAFSPDGRRLASAGDDTVIKLWEPATGREVLTLSGHSGPVNGVAFSPDGRLLASAGDGPTIKLWDLGSGKELRSLAGHAFKVTCVAFSPDGTRLASASDDRTVRLWEPASGREVLTLRNHTGGTTGVAFSPDGKWLASTSCDGTVKLWDARPPEP